MAAKTAKPDKAKEKRTRKTRPDEDALKPSLSQEHKKKLKEYKALAGDGTLGYNQFYAWYLRDIKGKAKTVGVKEDPNVKLIQDALIKIKQDNDKFSIPRGGYLIKSGRMAEGKKGPQFKIEAGPKKPPTMKS